MAESIIRDQKDGLVKRAYYRSTTGFQAALGETINVYMGGVLDAKVKNNVSSLSNAGAYYFSNGGPGYGVLFMKASNIYYGGIVYGYRDTGIALFRANNGIYEVTVYE